MQNSSSPGGEIFYFNNFSFPQQTSQSYSYEIFQPGPESGISSHPGDCYYAPGGNQYDHLLVPEHYHQNRPNMLNSASSARESLLESEDLVQSSPSGSGSTGSGSTLPQNLYAQLDVIKGRPPTIIAQLQYQPSRWTCLYQNGGPNLRVEFLMEDGVPGLRMKDALKRVFTGLKGRDSRGVLETTKPISIRIQIVGYRPFSRQVKTMTAHNNPKPISLAELGRQVAKALDFCIRKNQKTDSDINFDNVTLVALERMSTASWQPVFVLA